MRVFFFVCGENGCRYSPRGRESQYYLELMSRNQTNDEDVTMYGHTLCRLAVKAFGDRPIDEMMLVNTFIRGLHNVDMKRHVYHEKCDTLNEAIHTAVAYEAFDRPLRESRKPRVTVAPVQGRGFVKQESPSNKDRPNPDSGSGAALTESMVRQIVKEAVAQNSQRRKRDYSTVECYHCHKMGHIERYCPDKRKSIPSQPGSNPNM